MKKHTITLVAAGIIMASCSKIEVTEMDKTSELQNTVMTDESSHFTRTFAKPDGSKELNGTPSENLKAILDVAGPDIITSLGTINITDKEYQEIKAFTDNLVAGKTTGMDKYTTIYDWVRTKIKFNDYSRPEYVYYGNDPYEVFVNKVAVCQGYSNLEVVMCHTQGIPAMVVNGFLVNYGMDLGHAWVYACPDDKWVVSDPTNSGSWDMASTSSYSHLKPMRADVDLFEDDYAKYNYDGGCLNVKEVTTSNNPLVVPYSVSGFVIRSFNPTTALPMGTAEIYFGQNITTLGEKDNMSLIINNTGDYLKAVYVDKDNAVLMDNKGIVYMKNGGNPLLYYIPGGMENVELLPMEVVEKNTIYNHMYVKEIYFPEGTKTIEDYAIENCPRLERIYVPEGSNVSPDALYNCPQDVEIIYGVPSSVKHVTM